VGGIAQTPGIFPQDALDCAAFRKLPNHSWYVGPKTSIGSVKISLADTEIQPRNFMMGGQDLCEIIEKKCGGSPQRAPAKDRASDRAANLQRAIPGSGSR
jgi:hypothetical protein